MRIEVSHANKRFGDVRALTDVSLTIAAGERVALVGPNGSGKSTLIRALLGLLGCEGRVELDGNSPYARRVEIAKRLAYVPQQAPLLGASVSELLAMITLTRALAGDVVARSAARFELDLSAITDRPFRHLSGGMKQKLLLAVAFASNASLLVLDEPTASLDARACEQFFAACAELPEATTVLLCSHRAQEVDTMARRIIALNEGRVAFDGPRAEYVASFRPRVVSNKEAAR